MVSPFEVGTSCTNKVSESKPGMPRGGGRSPIQVSRSLGLTANTTASDWKAKPSWYLVSDMPSAMGSSGSEVDQMLDEVPIEYAGDF